MNFSQEMAVGDSILDFGLLIVLRHGFFRYTANSHPRSVIQYLKLGDRSSYGRPYPKYEG